MILAYILSITVAALLVGAGFIALQRWLCRIPVAFAWNPNSHDKMTSNALHLLNPEYNRTEKVSLFSWVIERGARQQVFREQVINQLRRGSVDEDMSSNIWRTRSSKITQFLLEREKDLINQTYEGTNGAYHFFNPTNNQGLSEPTEQGREIRSRTVLLALPDECMKAPMPSAYKRAMHIIDNTRVWCMDFEARNYTVPDADAYFAKGYYPLSFYTMGRVLHLLQDMAVPAHVRNDCHFNIYDDNPEPLEYYADYRDAIEAGLPDMTPITRWSFNPSVQFRPRDDQFGNAKTILNGISGDNNLSSYGLIFTDLAEKTYRDYYSYGTIPGNGDSHNPDTQTEGPWYFDTLPSGHLSRCRPSTGGLADVLNLIKEEINFISMYVNREPGVLPKAFIDRKIDREKLTASDLIAIIETINEKMRFLPREDEILVQKVEIADGKYRDDTEGYDGSRECLRDLKRRWEGLDVTSLMKHLRSSKVSDFDYSDVSVSADDSIERILIRWLEEHRDTRALALSFSKPPVCLDGKLPYPSNNPARNWHKGFHGPWCLVSNNDEVKPEKGLAPPFESDHSIIHRQYLDLEAEAMGYSALLLTRWFESQFTETKGIEIWANKGGTKKAPPELGTEDQAQDAGIQNSARIVSGSNGFHIGIANTLPLEIDLCIELDLNEEEIDPDDRKIFAQGIPVPELLVTKYEGGHPKPKNTEPMKMKDGTTIERIPYGKTHLIERNVAPFNSYLMNIFHLPVTANFSLQQKGIGGIRREYEQEGLTDLIRNLGEGDPKSSTLFEPTQEMVVNIEEKPGQVRFVDDTVLLGFRKSSRQNYPAAIVMSIIFEQEPPAQSEHPTFDDTGYNPVVDSFKDARGVEIFR